MLLEITQDKLPQVDDFVHLHLHTIYSTLDGMCKLEPLMERAKELGMNSIAQTDHGHSGGALAFQKAAKKAGLKPILGAELYFNPQAKTIAKPAEYRNALCVRDIFKNEPEFIIEIADRKRDEKTFEEYRQMLIDVLEKDNRTFPDQLTPEDVKKVFTDKQINKIKKDNKKLTEKYECDTTQYHLILLAMNQQGWNNLIKIQSIASEQCTYNGRFITDFELLEKYSEGIICTTACFPEDTKVFTTDGYKNIVDIQKGDKVLTHKNRFMPVESTTKRLYTGNMAQVECKYMNNIVNCTEDHEFFILKKDELMNYAKKEIHDEFVPYDQIKKRRQTRKQCHKFNGEWIQAKDLKSGDFLLFPYYIKKEKAYFLSKYRYGHKIIKKTRKYKELKNYKFLIDDDFLWLLGMYAAEGNSRNINTSHRIQFTLNSDEINRIEKIKKIVKDIFGIESYDRVKGENRKGIDITFNSIDLVNLFESLFKKGFMNKEVPPFVFNLSPEKQMMFLKGAWEGDGHSRHRMFNGYDSCEITYSTASRNLMLSMQRILINNHIISGTHTLKSYTSKDGSFHNQSYHICCYGDAAKAIENFVYNDSEWTPPKLTPKNIPVNVDGKNYMACEITNVTLTPCENKAVYCLNVEEDHSFTAENIAVHNCIGSLFSKLIQRRRFEEAESLILKFARIFENRFYLEIQPLIIPQQISTNEFYLKIYQKHGLPAVATSDVHYIFKEDWDDHDTFLCISTGRLKDEKLDKEIYIKTHKKDPEGKGFRPRMRYTNDFWLRSKEEMVEAFMEQESASDTFYKNQEDNIYHTEEYRNFWISAMNNTVKIAAQISDDILIGSKETLYPIVKNLPPGMSSDEVLYSEALRGLIEYDKKMRLRGEQIDFWKYYDKIIDEMSVISAKHYSDYFLLVQEYVNWADSINSETGMPMAAVGPGRGSAASSLILNLIGITKNIDPIKTDLMFSRFLTMDRTSPPDYYNSRATWKHVA